MLHLPLVRTQHHSEVLHLPLVPDSASQRGASGAGLSITAEVLHLPLVPDSASQRGVTLASGAGLSITGKTAGFSDTIHTVFVNKTFSLIAQSEQFSDVVGQQLKLISDLLCALSVNFHFLVANCITCITGCCQSD